jgi:hypothetical protein
MGDATFSDSEAIRNEKEPKKTFLERWFEKLKVFLENVE